MLAVDEVHAVTPERFRDEIAVGYAPVIMRGVASQWPAVRAGRGGPAAMAEYLARFGGRRPLAAMIGPPAIKGRFFYSDDFKGLNFDRVEIPLETLVGELLKMAGHPAPPAVYAGAVAAADSFPGFAAENVMPLDVPKAIARLWVGNASQVAAHYDGSANIAVVAAGKRRFSLFPPEQGANLYVGPLDFTVAGQPTSMVDLEAIDLERFPLFSTALNTMRVADLAPGDALFIPPFWWHGVKAEGPLNVLVNYWYGEMAALSPFTALIHALVSIRDLPQGERAAVRDWFERYVFNDAAAQVADHLPPHVRGVLGPPGPERDARARDYLLKVIQQ